MSDLTPAYIMDTLTKISGRIDAKTNEIADLDALAVRARVAHKTGYANQFLRCAGSMDIRRYTAELETADTFLASELADQQLRAAVGAIKALRDSLEVCRSLSPLLRLEWGQA